jgi:hypothetical protein
MNNMNVKQNKNMLNSSSILFSQVPFCKLNGKSSTFLQIEWKCSGLSKDNFKHKLYTAHNIWEEAPFPSLNISSLKYILGLFSGTTSKCHFSPKIGTLVVSKLWSFISFSNKVFFYNAKNIFYSLQKDLSNSV